jgi:four helix bundle protein
MATFDHEKLNVYTAALEFVRFTNELSKTIPADQRHMRDQFMRAASSIPLNIAEGNGKLPFADRRRFFEISRGSAMECAAALDVLVVCGVVAEARISEGKLMLARIVRMLTGLAHAKSSRVREEATRYGENVDRDEDKDEDKDEDEDGDEDGVFGGVDGAGGE